MLKHYFILTCCFLLALFSSCKNEKGVSIKGEISNLEYPYILASYISADTLAIDTVEVNNNKGKFSYRADIDTLTIFTLYFNNYNSSVVVFADNGEKISVKGDAQMTDLIRVTGNGLNNELTSFKNQNEELLKQRGHQFQNLRKIHEMDSSLNRTLSLNDEIVHINSLNHELIQRAEEYIKENPSKLSSLILINDFFTNIDNPQALARVLEYVQGDALKTPLANRLKNYSEKINRSAEGAQMPYFQLTDNNEKSIRSYDYSGKFLLLSFISAAGDESREMVKTLKNSYKSVNKDSVQFISIYIDTDIYPIEYLKSDSIPWTIIPEKKSWASDIADTYNVQYVPYNILISPNGKIKDRNIPAQEVANAIKKTPED